MVTAIVAVAWFQAVLHWFGWILARIYDAVPNYGLAIIILTVGIRVLLLPLGVKQIRSMHAMQTLQPKIKQLQQKYKGNRQKLQEELAALYREHGYNPLSGCLPMILQFPVLICLYAVLVVPKGIPHIPNPSALHTAIVRQASGIHFLGTNMLCTATEAGAGTVQTKGPNDYGLKSRDCGRGLPVRIPYYLIALFMVGTQYYQQRQMNRANPATDPQQQMLTRVMPLVFGIWGFIFPMGLVVYWTTSNIVQIIQQHFMLPRAATVGAAPPKSAVASDGGSGRSAEARPGGQGGSRRSRRRRSGQGQQARSSIPRAKPGGQTRKPVGGKGPRDAGSRKKRS